MNPSMFSALLTIASAPVIDPVAPLPIALTTKGWQTLRAHDAPVPTLRRRQGTPTTACGLCGDPVNSADDCSCDDGICLKVTTYRSHA
jgi:hypothetical protein